MTPGSASQGSVKHGSLLDGNFWPYRVSSQWKSTTLLLYVVTTIRHFRAEADAAWTASFA
jgi:hypothetical protein